MTDSPIQEQAARSEAISMAINLPIRDALTTLLDEGRQGAYSLRQRMGKKP